MLSFSPCGLIGLAPMAGPGDSGFRRICRECGADYTVTEMISAKAIRFNSERTIQLAKHTSKEAPILIQLFGREPESMEYAASFVCDHFSPAGIDINMGCPAPKIFNNGDGSALLREPDLAAKLVRAAIKGCNVPVSVKIRIGIDYIDDSVVDFARIIQDAGAAFITVHGRTREQFYAGKANYEMIKRIKDQVEIPVIANGDVIDCYSAEKILCETGADGLMLARGALGNPDVFGQIKGYFTNKTVKEISLTERFGRCLKQLAYTVEDKGEEKACIEFRKHMLWYLKGIPGSAAYKVSAGQISCVDDCKKMLEQVLLEKNKDRFL